MTVPNPPVQDDDLDDKKGPGLREDVMLEDVGKTLKQQEEDAKKAADEAEAARKAELEAKARRDATAGDDPRIEALKEALRISEESRLRQASLAAPVAPVPEPPKKLSREELNELYAKDPIAAIAMMQEEALRTVTENVEKRLLPLVAGGASSAEAAARARHPEAFELFGAEMKTYVDKLPDKSVMNRAEAWDDLVSYFQGQPANLEKIVAKRLEKAKTTPNLDDARERERASAGGHTRSEIRAPAPTSKTNLDETEREIARAMNPGMTPEEAYADYAKWKRVGRQ